MTLETEVVVLLVAVVVVLMVLLAVAAVPISSTHEDARNVVSRTMRRDTIQVGPIKWISIRCVVTVSIYFLHAH